MRILVVSAFEAGSLKANAINTAKMADAFASLGHKVTVICRRPVEGKATRKSISMTYGLAMPMGWVQIPRQIMGIKVGPHWKFARLALPIALSIRPDLVYARHYIFPWISSRMGMPTVAESHDHPGTSTHLFEQLVKAAGQPSVRLWVTISERLAEHYRSLGVPAKKLVVLPDAVDLNLFQRPKELPPNPYPLGGPHVTYAGHLYDYKGIPTVLETASRLPKVTFHLVGGLPTDITRQKARALTLGLPNLTFHGLKPHPEVPPYLWYADALVLPNSQHHPSANWTSPLKLGEYLASGTPVVASDIPALRDWVTENEVEFVLPDDPEALARGIQRVLADKERARQLRQSGLEKAQTLSYRGRARSILNRCGVGVESNSTAAAHR